MSSRRGSIVEIEPEQSLTCHGWPGREQVMEVQRARILASMVEEIAERGVANVTVGHVVARSGVSRRTFYEIFEDREGCFLAAFDEGVSRLASEIVRAYEMPGDWNVQIRSGVIAALSALDHRPAFARLLIVESLGAGPVALEHRSRVLAKLVDLVHEGGHNAKAGLRPARLTAEGAVGAALSVIHTRLLEERHGQLVELAGPLTGMIVLPYLGAVIARREMKRPIPKGATRPIEKHGDPLRNLGMRLTYRTIRVLSAIAGHPNSSNREVADKAGISDQGQTSKLLGRLLALGLIERAATGLVRGEPNAWRLTSRGEEVERAIGAQTGHY